MPDIWCGNEDTSFPNGDFFSGNTGSGTRSPYSRVSLGWGSNQPAVGQSFFFTPQTSCWFSAWIYFELAAGEVFFGLGKSGTALPGTGLMPYGLYLGSDHADNSKVALFKSDVGNNNQSACIHLATESGNSLPFRTLFKADIQFINYGASATVNVYINTALVLTYFGNIASTGVTGLDTVVITAGLGGANVCGYSEFLVSTYDTRQASVQTLAVNTAGDLSQWTGIPSDVSEIFLNQTTSVYTGSSTQEEDFTVTPAVSGTLLVSSVNLCAWVQSPGVSSPSTIALGVRESGVNYPGVNQMTNGRTIERLLITNPATGKWFTVGELAFQLSLESGA